MIWIVGECAERIDNADELLESFLEGFHEEHPSAAPSAHCHSGAVSQETIRNTGAGKQVLNLATQDSG